MATDNRSATTNHNKPHNAMTATAIAAPAITAAATALVESLHSAINATHAVGQRMADLYNAHKGDPAAIGADLWEAWNANPLDRSPARILVDACSEANIPRKEASLILNASGIVSKQRISQLLAIVYDGDLSKNKSAADRRSAAAKAAGQGPLDKPAATAASPTDKALDQIPHSPEAPKLTPFEAASQPLHPATTPTFEDLMRLVSQLPSLTKAQASEVAKALMAKVK